MKWLSLPLWCVALFLGWVLPPPRPEALLLGLGGVVLDGLSPRLPSGFYRISLPLYLALLWLGWVPLALVAALLGLVLLPEGRKWTSDTSQGLAFLSLASLARTLGGPLLLPAVCLVGSLWGEWRLRQLPSDLQGRRLQRALRGFEWSLSWPALLLVDAASPLGALAALPVLYLLGQGAENAAHRVYAVQATLALEQEQASRRELVQLRQHVEQQQTSLAQESRQRQMVERLAEQLARGPSFEATQKAVVDTLRQLVPATSVALFLRRGSQLEPSLWHSPRHAALEQAGLTGIREPLVELCWERAHLVQRQGDGQLLSELFPEEDQALALHVHEVGVIYLGRSTSPWTADEVQLLQWVASKAALGLQAAWRHQQQQQQQQQQRVLNLQLREQVELLEQLVEGGGWLGSQLTAESALVAFEGQLRELIPHEQASIYRGEDAARVEAVHSWSSHPEGLADDFLRQLARATASSGRGRVYAPERGLPAILAVPILAPPGAIVLAGQEFHNGQVYLLELLALQLGITLRNAQLYSETQLARQQLEASQAQLIQSSKLTAIGQLAAGVAHELNTPLGAVSLSLDLIANQVPKAESQVENAQAALERAKNIIDKLLIYSRRSSDFDLELVSLAAVVEGAHDLVKPKLKQERIRYQCTGQGNFLVKAKTVELQQVLVNLLLNAADAYAEGVVDRPLEVRYGGDSTGHCWIEVEDRAGGVPEDIQDQLFDPFFTTKAIGKGTGLGLAIGKEICQQYQGELTFVSHPGQGTVFRMTLPRVG